MPQAKLADNSDPLTYKIISAAIEVHDSLGPGLLESAYGACLQHEFQLRGIDAITQKQLLVKYKDVQIDCSYRLDFVVENQVIVELKSVSELLSIHEAQLLSYLKLSGFRKGLLINFNVKRLKSGIKRLII